MVEDTLRPGCARARDGRLVVEVWLPWYRSLPLSCLETVEVTVDDRPVEVHSVGTAGQLLPLDAVGAADGDWDLRAPLEVVTGAAVRPGEEVGLEVRVALRIPYLMRAPGVPLVQQVRVGHRDVVRPDPVRG